MKARAVILLMVSLMLCVFTSCGTINKENLKKLKTKEYKNYTLFYENILPEMQIKDYDIITDNMYSYLTGKLGLSFVKPHFNLAVLPIENDVVQFQKRNTNACTDYETIYLIDMFNLSEEMYEKYGDPPEGIANNAFTHELAHLMTHGVIEYNGRNKLRPEEMNATALAFIDFTASEFNLLYDLSEIITNNFSKEQYGKLQELGIASLKNASEGREPAVFLLYLYMHEEYDKVMNFLEANDLDDFIGKANWSAEDDKWFMEWINMHYNGF